jgi:hypothetical protein
MRGRYPLGVEGVDAVPGPEQAKERVKAIVATLRRECRVQEACERLGISQQRFQQIREDFWRGAVASQLLQAAGRKPRRRTAAEQRIAELEAEVAELQAALRTAQTREEIALILPQVGQEQATAAEKKTPAAKARKRGRPPGKRTST